MIFDNYKSYKNLLTTRDLIIIQRHRCFIIIIVESFK